MKTKPYEPVIWFNENGPMWEYSYDDRISLRHLDQAGAEGWEVISVSRVPSEDCEPYFEVFVKRRVMVAEDEE